MLKTLLVGFMLMTLMAALPLNAQEVEQPNRLYVVNGNTIYLINPSAQPATIEPIATIPGTIICSRWVDNGEALLIGEAGSETTEQGIYRLSRDSHELELLVTVGFDETVDLLVDCPLVSPNGEWVAFRTRVQDTGSGALYSVRTDGTDKRELVQMQYGADQYGRVRWSYDSQWMIFYGSIGGESGYWRIRPDGTELALLSPEELAQLLAALSPDGQWIAYEQSVGQLRVGHLADGSTEEISVLEGEEYSLFPPVWTPNSQGLLVISAIWTGDDGTFFVRRVSLNDSQITLLFEIPFPLGVFTGLDRPMPPIWSPDQAWTLIPQTGQLLNGSTGELVDLPYVTEEILQLSYIQEYMPMLWGDDSQFFWYVGTDQDVQKLYRFDVTTREVAEIITLPDAPVSNLIIGWWQN